jgi:hypothetical protein
VCLLVNRKPVIIIYIGNVKKLNLCYTSLSLEEIPLKGDKILNIFEAWTGQECTKWSCKTLFEMEDTDILYTNNHVVTYVPDPNQTFRL